MTLNKQGKKFVMVYNELTSHFSEYLRISKLARKCKMNNRTALSYVQTMEKLNLFSKPLCEWHDEDLGVPDAKAKQ